MSMTCKQWMDLNPHHRVGIEPGVTKPIRAVLHGGSGLDRRIVGEGDDPNQAIDQALTVRQSMRDVLP